MRHPDTIHKLVAHPGSGIEISEVAEACYELSKQLGIRVDFIHNDRYYKVSLEYHEKDSESLS